MFFYLRGFLALHRVTSSDSLSIFCSSKVPGRFTKSATPKPYTNLGRLLERPEALCCAGLVALVTPRIWKRLSSNHDSGHTNNGPRWLKVGSIGTCKIAAEKKLI